MNDQANLSIRQESVFDDPLATVDLDSGDKKRSSLNLPLSCAHIGQRPAIFSSEGPAYGQSLK